MVECAYVEQPLFAKEGVPFFSTKVKLGKNGERCAVLCTP